MTKTLYVSLPSDKEVRIARDFKAPRDLVWQCHTDTKLFQRWIGGMPGWSMPVCEMDVRPGGRYRWYWRYDENGTGFGFFGEFKEVRAPETMTQEEYFDPGDSDATGGMKANTPSINRTTLVEKNGVTTLIVLIDYGSKEARDAAIGSGMTDGMEISYERLDRLVAKQQEG